MMINNIINQTLVYFFGPQLTNLVSKLDKSIAQTPLMDNLPREIVFIICSSLGNLRHIFYLSITNKRLRDLLSFNAFGQTRFWPSPTVGNVNKLVYKYFPWEYLGFCGLTELQPYTGQASLDFEISWARHRQLKLFLQYRTKSEIIELTKNGVSSLTLINRLECFVALLRNKSFTATDYLERDYVWPLERVKLCKLNLLFILSCESKKIVFARIKALGIVYQESSFSYYAHSIMTVQYLNYLYSKPIFFPTIDCNEYTIIDFKRNNPKRLVGTKWFLKKGIQIILPIKAVISLQNMLYRLISINKLANRSANWEIMPFNKT